METNLQSIEHCCICGKQLNKRQIERGNHVCSRSCSQKKRYLNPEERRKSSIASKFALSKPEVKEKLSRSIKQGLPSKEVRYKISIRTKERWSSEEYRDRVISSMRQYHSTDDAKQKKSSILKERWSNKEYKRVVSQKISNSLNKPEVKEKQSASIKKALSNKDTKKRQIAGIKKAWSTNKLNIKAKEYETKRKNNSFNKSEPEETSYELLLQHFDKDDIIRWHITKEYPFEADFYIKSLNLYIEGHYSQYHHGCPFDSTNEEHLKELERLKYMFEITPKNSYGTNQYGNMIKEWTIRDPKKRQVAIDNKLNWIAFYQVEDLKRWLNDIRN